MKAPILLLTVAMLNTPLFFLPCHTQGATAIQAWAQRYNGTARSSDWPCAIACDPAGGVAIALYTGDHFSGGDILVMKYSSTRAPLWTNRYDGPANNDEWPTALAVDARGNVFVAGYGYSDRNSGYCDAVTLAYCNTGVPLWTNHYRGSLSLGDAAEAVAVDNDGRVFVAGYSGNFFTTLAYSADGVALWTNYYNPYNNFAEAKAVTVDDAGNVFVAGVVHDSNGRDVCATVAYSGTGSTRWTALFQNSPTDFASVNALAVDRSGKVFVTGSATVGSAPPDCLLLAYSNTGLPLWTNLYNGPGNSYDEGCGVAVDSGGGKVFMTGHSRGVGTGLYDWATLAYSSDGEPLWTNRYTGPGSSDDNPSAIALDGSGSVFVTCSSPDPAGRQGFATIKYSSSGDFLWLQEYRESTSTACGARALTVDSGGNVFVLGLATGGPEQNLDCLTIGYSGTGLPLWTNRYDGPGNGNDICSAVAVDGAGNVFVTGSSTGSSTSQDFLTLAFSPAGLPLWANRYGAPGYAADQATALAVDDLGNVFVTGSSGTNSLDYTTVAYSGAGLALWTNSYNGAGNGSDKPIAVAVSGNRRVFVAGNAVASGGSFEVATLAYSAAGTPLWTNHFFGGATISAEALTVDGDGNVFMAASFMGTNGAYDFLTLGYSSNGAPLWTNVYGSPDNREEYARALTTAPDGRVVVAGYSGSDSVTIAYSGAGLPLWTNRVRASGGSSERASALAADASGNVFAAGYSYASPSSYNYLVFACSASGALLWTNGYNGPANGDDRATAVAVDAGGNVFVTGYSAGAGGSSDYVTIAYSNGGVPLWTNRYDGPAGGTDRPPNRQCLALDRSGSVVVAGYSDADLSPTSTVYDYAVVKYIMPPAMVGFIPCGPSAWHLSCSGMPRLAYLTQFATNLTSSPWFNLCTNTTDDVGLWSTTDCTADAQRFYRLRSLR